MPEALEYTAKLENGPFVEGLRKMRESMEGLRTMIAPLAAIAAGFAGAATAAEVLKKSMEEAAQDEQLTTSFVTLLGSVDKARARMKELADFADNTPFELPQVAEASRVLETLTGGALATGKGLTLVGDIAAGANRPFGEVAESVGRLYDALQNGTDLGEAMRSLQMMGAISGDTKRRLEELQASGAKGPAVWAVAEKALGRFSGGMQLQSHTWNGLLSTLHDTINHAFAAFGEPILDTLKPALEWLISVTKKLAPLAEEFGQKLQAGFQTLMGLFSSGQLWNTIGDGLKYGFAVGVNYFVAGMNGAMAGLMAYMKHLPELVMLGFKRLTNPDFWMGLVNILGSVGAGFNALLIEGIAPLVDKLIELLNKIHGIHIDFNADDLAQASKQEAADYWKTAMGQIGSAYAPEVEAYKKAGIDVANATAKAFKNAPKLLDDKVPASLQKVADSLHKNIVAITKAAEVKGDDKSGKTSSPAAAQAKVGKELAADSYAKIGLFVGGNSPALSEARRTNSLLSGNNSLLTQIVQHLRSNTGERTQSALWG